MRFAGLFVALVATFFLAAVSADALAQQANATCVLLKNKDRLGFDLKNVKGSYFTCTRACERTPGCISWAWNDYKGGTCWLKSRAGKIINKPGVLTTNCVRDTPSLVCNVFADIEFVGNDLTSKPGARFKDCCDVCNETPGCSAYSWSDHKGGTCWLKKSVDRAVRKRGVVSSVTVPLTGPVCAVENDTNFVGNDIGSTAAADPGACCAACKAFKDCKAYSWTTEGGGTCWLKKVKGKANPAVGVVSGALAGV